MVRRRLEARARFGPQMGWAGRMYLSRALLSSLRWCSWSLLLRRLDGKTLPRGPSAPLPSCGRGGEVVPMRGRHCDVVFSCWCSGRNPRSRPHGPRGSSDGVASASLFLLEASLSSLACLGRLAFRLSVGPLARTPADWAEVMVTQQSSMDVMGWPWRVRLPSTTGSAHRCRRPSLGYPTPFDCVWSRRRTALRPFDALSRLSDALRHGVVAQFRLSDALQPCQRCPLLCSCLVSTFSSTEPNGLLAFGVEILTGDPPPAASRCWRHGVSVGSVLPTSPSHSVSSLFSCIFFVLSPLYPPVKLLFCCKNMARQATFRKYNKRWGSSPRYSRKKIISPPAH